MTEDNTRNLDKSPKLKSTEHNIERKPRIYKIKSYSWHMNKGKFKKEKIQDRKAKFSGRVPIPKILRQKYNRGQKLNVKGVKTNIHRKKQEYKEANVKFSEEHAARAEILLTEDFGFLEPAAGETTTQFTQKQIVENVDIAAATKHFTLQLNEFGPYKAKYSKNGRHLLLGGRMGHVAAFDWITKKLSCELNVMESVHDICWLHIETMFAVAQKDWVYIYDNQGIELHCIKRLNRVLGMEFLPYHFLLAAANEDGYLSWLDVSIGQLVAQFNTKMGRLNMLAQNPYNAALCLGHGKGVVTMWAPNTREPLAKMLCHKAPLTALHVNPKGSFMATAAINRELKIWDIRKLQGPLQTYKLKSAVTHVVFSQGSMLGLGMGNIVEVYRDCCINTAKRAYLRHHANSSISSINFCPFEDVLGIGTGRSFESILVPGSGEANFDGQEPNPYQTKSQRREAEVKALLEKIQPDLIGLDPTLIAEVDIPTLKDKIEAKKKLLYVKPPKINYEPKKKAKGMVKVFKNKKIAQEDAKKEFIRNKKAVESSTKSPITFRNKGNRNILDRFLPKSKS